MAPRQRPLALVARCRRAPVPTAPHPADLRPVGLGTVRVNGELWSARSLSGPVEAGAWVRIEQLDGLKVRQNSIGATVFLHEVLRQNGNVVLTFA